MPAIRRVLFAILSVMVLSFCPVAARADGFIVINQPSTPVPVPPGHFTFAPLEVSFHHVNVEIKDQVAVTSVDQEFVESQSPAVRRNVSFPAAAGRTSTNFRWTSTASSRRPSCCRRQGAGDL